MQSVPQELLAAYAEIIRSAPGDEAAAAHLLSFLLDAENIRQSINIAIEQARQRAGLAAVQ